MGMLQLLKEKNCKLDLYCHWQGSSQFEPLTVRIQNILRQYPDGGQILKELLQNAGTIGAPILSIYTVDDARAKSVKFLYNHNSYGSESLFSGTMNKFQGPALYAYNSAIFEEKASMVNLNAQAS